MPPRMAGVGGVSRAAWGVLAGHAISCGTIWDVSWTSTEVRGRSRRPVSPPDIMTPIHGSMTPAPPQRRAPAVGVVRLASILLVSLLTACGEDGGGVTEPDVTTLQGVVVRAGTQVLLSDVPVTLNTRTVRSSDRGQYRFEDIPTGQATLSASLAGYLPYQRRMTIEEGVNTFDIALIPDG